MSRNCIRKVGMMKKIIIIFLIVIIVFYATSFILDRNKKTNSENDVELSNISNDSVVDLSHDYDASLNLDSLIDKSETIIVGRMVEQIDSINLLRNPSEPIQVDEERYAEGERILFDVSMVLKGEVESDKVAIVLHKTYSFLDENNKMSEMDLPTYNPPNFEDTMILFLNESYELNKIETINYSQFMQSSTPNTFMVTDDGLEIYESSEYDREQFEEKKFTMKYLLKKLGIEINY